VKEFLRHDELILMDNNILAHEHGIKQLEWLTTQRVRVDINAGLDARLIKETEAKLLAKLMWLEPPRMACDRVTHLNTVCHAIETMRWYNVEPRRYFVYVLVKKETFDEALHIVRVLKGYDVDIYVSPYRAIDGTVDITPDMADLARWANRRAICKSIPWEDYSSGVRGKSQFKKRRRLYRREK
jgi:hypothetical protein